MRIVLACLLLGHGIAHLPGFLVGWQLASFPELPFSTTVIGKTIDVGLAGARIVGAAWMIVSVLFVILAVAVALRPAGWPQALPVALALSTVLCVLGWPEARFGLAMNGLLALSFAFVRFG